MNIYSSHLLAMWSPGPIEMIVLGIILLLAFGRKLPEMARGLGKSFVEFKKGLNDVNPTKGDVVNDVKKATGEHSVDDSDVVNVDVLTTK